ncbi:uncharacterized protein FIBRA_07197 [Fibroporia radiculosa]|uniref:Uncharacterized protein n=1 Tax=Fibroporia radiculosa TaxID=599839 RepID=J4H4H4_9APHY|nr:uncharacterized protein FIBRA_07197 [Fibroporia radiculosa]CCM04999.1 predicted protein [Fibroporia radiculosa]
MSTIRTMVWTPVSIGYDNVTPWLVARGCRPRNMTLVFSPWEPLSLKTSIHETLVAAGTALDHLSLFIYDFYKIPSGFSLIPAYLKISTLCIRLVNRYSRIESFSPSLINLPALCKILESIGPKHTKLQQLLLGFELDRPCLDTDWSETGALLARMLVFHPHLAVTIRISPHRKRNDGHEWMEHFVSKMVDGLSRSLARTGRVTLIWAFHHSQLPDS